MTTIKSYTDIEQSKKLAEILPIESADYHYIVQGEESYFYPYSLSIDVVEQYNGDIKYIPCWSLAALLSTIPIEHNLHGYLTENGMEYRMETLCAGNSKRYNNQVDACVEMIIELKELKIL